MRKSFLASALLGVLVIGVCVAAVPPAANFAGTWVLDKAASSGLQGNMANADVTMVVTQDAKTLSTETTVKAANAMGSNIGNGGFSAVLVSQGGGGQGGGPRPPQKASYNLDGSPMSVEGRNGGKTVYTAKWIDGGNGLELKNVRTANMQGNDITITTTDTWTLSGSALNIHRVSEGNPRGNTDQKLVFKKQ